MDAACHRAFTRSPYLIYAGNPVSAHLGRGHQIPFSDFNYETGHERDDSSAADNIPKENEPDGSFLSLGSLPSMDTACRALIRSPGYDITYAGQILSYETGHERDDSSIAKDINKDNGSPLWQG
ncbi:hypothetical protein COCNU_scaffold031917G000010 [Cocos nucifera]|nr:hypothetical protein [Cocos nucifera]